MISYLSFALLYCSLLFMAYDPGSGVFEVVGARLVTMVTSTTMLLFYAIDPSTFKAPAPKLIFLISTAV